LDESTNRRIQGTRKCAAFDQDAVDGTKTAVAIILLDVDASAADAQATAVVRDAIVNAATIKAPSDLTAPERTQMEAELMAQGIVVRAGEYPYIR
jgi:hypothetical protein